MNFFLIIAFGYQSITVNIVILYGYVVLVSHFKYFRAGFELLLEALRGLEVGAPKGAPMEL